MRDVARHAGVSVATVSRVLNRAENVSATTRATVEDAIRTLEFVPNSAARAINSGRTRLVGALIPTLDHAIFARFLDSVAEGLDGLGLSLVVATTDNTPQRELERAKKLLDIGAEALIVSGITRAEGFESLIARHKVPVIATSYFDAQSTFPTIGYDNARVARMALEHLLSLGHTKIGVLSGPARDNDRTRARQDGLRDIARGQLHFAEAEMNFAAAGAAAVDLRHAHPELTALLCLSDVLAQGALLRFRADGVDVPKMLSIVGIDDLPTSASFDPPLTTVHLPVGEMGARTAQAAAQWIETGDRPPSVDLHIRLVERRTTGPSRDA